MLIIKNITAKNFMSVGNVTQAVHFNDAGLTLVLGNNLDLGGDGSRNGTGKTTIINALRDIRARNFDVTVLSPSSLEFEFDARRLDPVGYEVLKTERDAADSGFISVLRVIGSFVNMSPHKKLADEASIANNLLAALGHEPESVLKKGERLTDHFSENLDDYR